MSVQLKHTIVWCRDQQRSAMFFTEIFGRTSPKPFGHFLVVELDNGVSLDFSDVGEGEVASQHYAFLVGEDDFTKIFGRVRDRGSSTGPIRLAPDPAKSITVTTVGACISRTPTDTSWRSSHAPTAAASECGGVMLNPRRLAAW
jgi:hypothetical protein